MLFVVYGPDGQIVQSNKVYQPEGYDKILEERKLDFIPVDCNTILGPDEWWVNVKAQEIVAREDMPIQIDTDAFKVNGIPLLIRNIPLQARVKISVLGKEFLDAVLNDTELLLESETPGFYDIRIELWPYLPWTRRVEAMV